MFRRGQLMRFLAVCALFTFPFLTQATVVQHWLVLGPFPYSPGSPAPLQASGLKEEADLQPRAYEPIANRFWMPISADSTGKVDFLRLGFEQVDYVNTYLHTYLYSPSKRDVELAVGVNDGAIIWVNGKKVFVLPTGHGRKWERASRRFGVVLQPGWNRVLCKVSNLAKNYAFSMETEAADVVPSTEGPAFGNGSTDWLVTWLGLDQGLHLLSDGGLRGELALGMVPNPTKSGKRLSVVVAESSRKGTRVLGRVQVSNEGERGERTEVFELPLSDLFAAAAQGEGLEIRLRCEDTPAVIKRPLRFPGLLLLRTAFMRPLVVDRWRVYEHVTEGAISNAAARFAAAHASSPGTDARVYTALFHPPVWLSDFSFGLALPRPTCLGRAFWQGLPMAHWDRDGSDVVAWQAKLKSGERGGSSNVELVLVGPNLGELPVGWPSVRLLAPELEALWNNAELAGQVLGRRFVPDETTARQWIAALLSGGQGAFSQLIRAYQAQIVASARPLRADTINFIGNSHIDLQWMWRWHETVNVCKATFGQALRFMQEYPDFMYAQSQAQAYVWMEEFAPEIFEGIQRAVKRGQWVVVGDSWCEPDANVPSGESHVRQILYGKRYFRKKLGTESRTVWLPDTFGFPATLPKIFKHCEMDYFATQKLRFHYEVPFPYDVFWWQAKDGSRLLSFMTYGYDTRLHEVPSFYLQFKQNTRLDNVLFLYGVGDHGGGPSRRMIRTIHRMEQADAFPVVRHLRPDDAFARMPQPGVKIPTWKDELYLQFHRGTYTSQSELKKANRRLEILLAEAERFNALRQRPYPPWRIEQAWRKVLLEQFHDVLAGTSIPGVYKDVFAEYDIAERWSREIRDAALQEFESRIDTRGKGVPVVVWNSLPWTRTDVARVQLPPGFKASQVTVVDGRGREVPSQVSEGDLVWLAREVPAVGYRVYWLRAGKPKPQNRVTVEGLMAQNRHLRLELDPETGRIRNLLVKSGQKFSPVVRAEAGANALVFLEDEGNAWNLEYTGKVDSAQAVAVKRAEVGPVFARFRVVRRYGRSRFVQDILVYRDLPRVDVRTTADWHAKHLTAKAAFPLAFEAGSAFFDQPYGVVERPTVPRTAIDSTKFEVSGQKWVDMSSVDGEMGLALLDDSKYGYDVRPDRLRLTLLRSATSPDPDMDQGTHVFTYALYPHTGNWRLARVPQEAWQMNAPLICRIVLPHSGTWPNHGSFLSVQPENVFVSVLKLPEEGDGRVLRLVELYGRPAEVRLELPWVVRAAHRTDALEEKNFGAVTVQGRVLRFRLRPFELATLRIEVETAKAEPVAKVGRAVQ